MAEESSAVGEVFGTGEVARDLTRVDWAATPLGPPPTWSRALRTVVRVLLGSRFSMWMAWGAELTFFCNEAYRQDTLGRKYPWALGRPASEVWEEIWPDIGPRIDSVLSKGEATWDESLRLFLERSGYREETYHTFSYSPLWDDDDAIRGMLCVVTEETERVIGVRRMTTLRDLGAVASGADEDGYLRAAVASLAGNPRSLPFVAVYLRDNAGNARLAGASGIEPGHPAAPPALHTSDPDAAWPLQRATGRTIVTIESLQHRFGELPRGVWDDPPHTAVLAPLPSADGQDAYGFLVVGANPYRIVDADYRDFVGLIAQRLAAGITSVRGLAAERDRAEALAELDRARSMFIGNVSHEFRTPLTLIAGPTEEALADPDQSATQRARWEVVRRNAGRLRRLVDDMLDFSRIEAGVLQPQRVAVDLPALTSDVVASFAPALERAGLTLHTELEPLPAPALVDLEMWEKMILNLLSNAVKYTRTGSVTVRLRRAGERAELSVTDTGVGVAADQQPLLFNRFHRVRDAGGRSHEGAGIGLALVQELARLHGGRASVRSRLGEGSTFTVAVPYDPQVAAAGTAVVRGDAPLVSRYLDEALEWTAPADGADGGRAASGREGAVLVADDNADLRRFVAGLLAAHWEVIEAPDGVAALELARTRRPDLVLADVMMPGLDGIELLSALRTDPQLRLTPVILLTARAGEDAAVTGLQAGADDYLPKPFAPQDLVARVRANLMLARLRNRESAFRAALVDALPEGIAIMDARGVVVDVNDGFESLTGYGRARLPYPPPHPWLADDASSTPAPSDFVTLRPGESLVAGRHRDGRTLRLAVTQTQVGAAAGDEPVSALTVRDVSAQHAAASREAMVEGLMAEQAGSSSLARVLERSVEVLGEALCARGVALRWPDAGGDAQVVAGDATALSATAAVIRRAARARPAPRIAIVEHGVGDAAGIAVVPDHELVVWFELAPPRPVTEHERALLGRVAGYLSLAVARIRREEEARDTTLVLQHAMLGEPRLPVGFAARYQAAVIPLEVGGDWYDVTELDGDRIGVVVGDCVGRGVAAAAVMGRLRSACQALMLTAGGPAAVLTALDRLVSHVPGAFAATAFCAVIDAPRGEIVYSCAGHLPAMLAAPDGATEALDGARWVPLGVSASRPRPEGTATLAPGSTLVFYTDGLVERRGESLDVGLGRLAASLAARAADGPNAIADQLMRSQQPPSGYEDDIAVVLYRQPPDDLRLALAADASVLASLRRELRRWLTRAGIVGDPADEIVLAIGEAAANAAEHAGGTASLDVTVSLSRRVVSVEVRDDGIWKPAVDEPLRGHGIPIMRAMMDTLTVEHGEAGTRVRMAKEIGR